MMTHDEMIAVIEHHKNGGKVQADSRYNPSGWMDTLEPPMWNFRANTYRAKPEPLVLWVEIDSDGEILNAVTKQPISQSYATSTLKKFVEVTE